MSKLIRILILITVEDTQKIIRLYIAIDMKGVTFQIFNIVNGLSAI